MVRAGDAEKRVWDLLTRDFTWDVPPDHPVKVFGSLDSTRRVRLQLFEFAMTCVLAEVQPQYVWHVTADGHDSGLDFIGRQSLFQDEGLGISAAITVGGQCKKRTHVGTVLKEIGHSLIDMIAVFEPSYIVVALSARVSAEQIEDARERIRKTCNRDSTIFDRNQIEGLFRQHLPVLEDIVRDALDDPDDVAAVLHYFADDEAGPLLEVEALSPPWALAGEPFTVNVTVRSTLVSMPTSRMWLARAQRDGAKASVRLLAPIAIDSDAGVSLARSSMDPLVARVPLEVVSHAVGLADLGELLVGHVDDGPEDPWDRAALGEILVVENMRPRYFEEPFRAGMDGLEAARERAGTHGFEVVGVVGAGGSGKSRLCDEFALRCRRDGSGVVKANQTKTHDDPHRVLADLLRHLADTESLASDDRAETVLDAVGRFDGELATRVAPSVRSLFGTSDASTAKMDEQSILSALILLIGVRTQRAPLVVHLQDLHWCTSDDLRVLGRLIDELRDRSGSDRIANGVTIILEGRVRESGGPLNSWTSVPFETFLDRYDPDPVTIKTFTPKQGLEFVRRLFEDLPHTARIVPVELLDLQRDMVRHIDRTAGGNPFHSLQQVQLLKERRVLGQNPETGLLYMIRAEPDDVALPDSVFESIELRWRYLHERSSGLALLLWACSLVEDRIPLAQFRHLRSELAPDVTVRDVEATDLLWTGGGVERDVVFRHENYFEAMRRFDVSRADRTRAVEAHSGWYASLRAPGPADRFRWARVLLEAPEPNETRARSLLRVARRGAERQGDTALARRISITELDLAWKKDARSPLPLDRYLAACDQELALLQDLLDADRPRAERRIKPFRDRVRARLARGRHRGPDVILRLQRRELASEVLDAKFLFNDQNPDRSIEIAGAAVRSINTARAGATIDFEEWDILEMEALHTYAIALAIGGQLAASIPFSARAMEIAWRYGSRRSRQVIGTHGNILLGVDPDAGVALLRRCLTECVGFDDPDVSDAADRIVIHLSIGLAILAHRASSTQPDLARTLRAEARASLKPIAAACFRLGLYPDAGAATLMIGVIEALEGDHVEAELWFAQAVAASARGRQLETLWKAHLNMAMALYRSHGRATQIVRDHALAALEIMEASLTSAIPEQSPRFGLLQLPLAHVVRLLVLAGDNEGIRVLERLPALRACFADPSAGVLRDASAIRGTALRVDDVDYVLY